MYTMIKPKASQPRFGRKITKLKGDTIGTFVLGDEVKSVTLEQILRDMPTYNHGGEVNA